MLETDNELWGLSRKEVMKLGINARYKGYTYLICAVMINVTSGISNASLYKDIYQRVADLNGVTVKSVEKCIRNSVDRVWRSSCNRYITRCAKDGRKPTNSDVIAFISDRIRLERGISF